MNKYRLKYSCICCVIYVHIFCYIRSYMCILLTCVHIFCSKSLSRSVQACMSMYAHIYKKYAHICTNIYNIHARYMRNTGITLLPGDVHI